MGGETHKLKSLIDGFNGKKVVVLGDIMLDHYVYTEPRKLSREAPVVVADYSSEAYRPGGAANLATILKRLGANVSLVGVVGVDADADKLLEALRDVGVDVSGVLSTERKTCVKRRIYVGRRQYLRIDIEDRSPVGGVITQQLYEKVSQKLGGAELIIISDHDKGTLTPTLIYSVIEQAKAAGKFVVGRPKTEHFFDYTHVDTMLATIREASEAVGVKILNDSSVRNLGFNVISRIECGSVYLYDQSTAYMFEQNSVTYLPPLVKLAYHEVIGLRDIITAAYGLAYASSRNALYASLISRVAETLFIEASNGSRAYIDSIQLGEGVMRFFSDGYAYRTVKVR